MNDALKTIFESAEALNENGLQVLALIAGVIRQVAPSAVESVALPETSSPVAEPSVAVPETSPVALSSVAEPLPEASPVEPSPVAPSSPTYRLVLNVPEIKDYKDVK